MLLEIAKNFYFNAFFPPAPAMSDLNGFDFVEDDEDAAETDWQYVEFTPPVWMQNIIRENERLKAAEAIAVAWSVALTGVLFIGAQTWLLTKV